LSSLALRRRPNPTLFPYTTLFRSSFGYYYTFETDFGESAPSNITIVRTQRGWSQWQLNAPDSSGDKTAVMATDISMAMDQLVARSEEHTSELQSRENLVCRLLLEK